jgi:flagellar FliL protein
MIRKLLPFLLGLLGLGIGIGAGLFLRPPPAEPSAEEIAMAEETEPTSPSEYVKLNNQFIVPIVEDGRVVSLVILSLSLEVETGTMETVFQHEPKLRDVFLQVMFDHANSGGFRGTFTDSANLLLLRRALTEAAKSVLGRDVKDVLISDINRQDS